jgi:predicted acylesterase/phospholipase RssA/CRP-like cAMP-binding protein
VLQTLTRYFNIEFGAHDSVLEELQVSNLAGGEWLMKQGDPGDALYFLVRGRLQAWARDESGNDKGHLLNEIVAGDSVGELSLLTGAPRAVGIQAIRDSLLIRLDREAFERMAKDYPALVMRLAANVATLLQSKSSGATSSTRNLKSITILPLDNSPRLEGFCRELTLQLENEGSTLSLSADGLGRKGAPVDSLQPGQAVPESLRNWLQDQENEHRFLVYHCLPGNAEWSHFALRHSDMVLLVGDAAHDPRPQHWEVELLETSGATIARQLLVLLQPPSSKPIQGTARWLEERRIDFHVHVREDQPDDLSRVTRIISGNALGLVLAGGAARGFAHLGVHRAMRELGLPIDWVGGTSLGAIMAACVASPISDDEVLRIARKSFVDGKPFSDFTIPLMSLISGRRMERMLRQHLDFQIEDLPIPFYCVSCNLDTGSTNLHESGDLPSALRASAALPGIIPPTVVNHRLAIDGSVVNNLPVDVMRQKPVGRIIAVDLSSAEQVMVDYPCLPSPWAILRGRYLPFFRKYRVPSLSNILLKATLLGTLDRVREQGERADILLTPPVRRFGLTEVKSFDKIVHAGYDHAITELGAWLERIESGKR